MKIRTANKLPNSIFIRIPPISQRAFQLNINRLQVHARNRYAAILGRDGQGWRERPVGEVGGDGEGEVGGIHRVGGEAGAIEGCSWHVMAGAVRAQVGRAEGLE